MVSFEIWNACHPLMGNPLHRSFSVPLARPGKAQNRPFSARQQTCLQKRRMAVLFHSCWVAAPTDRSRGIEERAVPKCLQLSTSGLGVFRPFSSVHQDRGLPSLFSRASVSLPALPRPSGGSPSGRHLARAIRRHAAAVPPAAYRAAIPGHCPRSWVTPPSSRPLRCFSPLRRLSSSSSFENALPS